jgi:Holliday junction resolvase RusA-like endonuclease
MTSLTLTLPWSVLVRDNAKYGVTINRTTRKPMLILTPEYRSGKDSAYLLAKRQMNRTPMTGPLTLVAILYEPNRSRGRDVTNFCKMVHDALEKAAYDNDSQLDDVRWIRGPVDAANPRVEITITSLPASAEE